MSSVSKEISTWCSKPGYLWYIKDLQAYIWYILFLSLLTGTTLSGQLYYGAKVGYSIPFNRQDNIKLDDANDFFIYRISFEEQDVSPVFSLVGHYRKDLIYFQTELAYKRVRTRFVGENFIDLDNITRLQNLKETHNLDIPFFAGFRTDRFKLGVGPLASIILSENAIFTDTDFFEERRKRVEMGFGFQIGFVFYRLHVELGYQYRFNEIGDYLYWRGTNSSFNQSIQYLDLGFGLIL